MDALDELWRRLSAVSTLEFQSKSQTGIGWEGSGFGAVQVEVPAPATLIFREIGSWQQDGGQKLRFSNVFRWSRTRKQLLLEHLRFGAENPVFLFAMEPDSNGIWAEITPHPCRDDCYRATLRVTDTQILMNWKVEGPNRNELIFTCYE